MKNKLVFATGIAVGYVLGSRAGRESYEKLKAKADELWNNPKVQETVSETTESLKHKAPHLQEQASATAKKAKDSVSGAMHRGHQTDGGKSAGTDTGPSGGNPADIEDPPFQNQSPDTRPATDT